MTDWTQAALFGWQILHTILIVVVLGYLLVVNGRLRELRSVRAEVQAWLTEFNKLITSGTLAARELKQSLAMAQLKMPGIAASREGRPTGWDQSRRGAEGEGHKVAQREEDGPHRGQIKLPAFHDLEFVRKA